jgi:hypothetical protein
MIRVLSYCLRKFTPEPEQRLPTSSAAVIRGHCRFRSVFAEKMSKIRLDVTVLYQRHLVSVGGQSALLIGGAGRHIDYYGRRPKNAPSSRRRMPSRVVNLGL